MERHNHEVAHPYELPPLSRKSERAPLLAPGNGPSGRATRGRPRRVPVVLQRLKLALMATVLASTASLFMGVGLAVIMWRPASGAHAAGVFADGASMACFDAHRDTSHTVVQIQSGTPIQSYRMLMRLDTVAQCAGSVEGISIVVADAKSLASESLVCQNRTLEGSSSAWLCSEVLLVGNHPSRRTRHLPTVALVREGAQALRGHESTSVGLDGEIRLCAGTRVSISSSRICFSESSVGWSVPAHAEGVTSVSVTSRGGWLVASANGDAARARDIERLIGAPPCSGLDLDRVELALLPTSCVTERSWSTTVLASEPSDQSIAAFRKAMRYGIDCVASLDGLDARTARAIQVGCSTQRLASLDRSGDVLCRSEPSIDYASCAARDLSLVVYADGNGTLTTWHDAALFGVERRTRTTSTGSQDSLDVSFYRLGMMVVAALILWTRREDKAARTDTILLSCIDTIHLGPRVGEVDEMHLVSRVLGALAFCVRFAVAFMMRTRLRADGLETLVWTEIGVSTASGLHWLHLHTRDCLSTADERHRRDGPRPRPDAPRHATNWRSRLGGSGAVVDVSCATLVTFADTPLADSDDTFDGIARFLTMTLITIVCVTRVIFSASCAITGTVDSTRMQTISAVLASAYWLAQAAETSYLLVELFVVPFATSVAHRSLLDPITVAVCLFVGFVGVGACPRISANARIIATHDGRRPAAGAAPKHA